MYLIIMLIYNNITMYDILLLFSLLLYIVVRRKPQLQDDCPAAQATECRRHQNNIVFGTKDVLKYIHIYIYIDSTMLYMILYKSYIFIIILLLIV